jgi:trans-aconitate methyltransferase
MADTHKTLSQPWDANLYDGRHAFVWQHGSSLVELLAPQTGERILDLGCGTGHLTARIAAAGANVVGLDHSEEMLVQARSAFPQIDFVLGDARDFSFPGPFDSIFSNAALHWVRPPDQVIRCVHAGLRPGGRFVAEFGGRGNVRAIVDAMRRATERIGLSMAGPEWFFPSISEYTSLLQSGGLEPTFAVLFDRPTPLQGESGLRDWVKMFARSVLDAIPIERREEFLHEVEKSARPELFEDGWFADYRRLRIVAWRRE